MPPTRGLRRGWLSARRRAPRRGRQHLAKRSAQPRMYKAGERRKALDEVAPAASRCWPQGAAQGRVESCCPHDAPVAPDRAGHPAGDAGRMGVVPRVNYPLAASRGAATGWPVCGINHALLRVLRGNPYARRALGRPRVGRGRRQPDAPAAPALERRSGGIQISGGGERANEFTATRAQSRPPPTHPDATKCLVPVTSRAVAEG